MLHKIHDYLRKPVHPITIDLIGCGGNGSQTLNCLAQLHTALVALDHPGLQVFAWDDDIVTDSNVGRQFFSRSDVGLPKVHVAIERMNRFLGVAWVAQFKKYTKINGTNILITCVDNSNTRKMLWDDFISKRQKNDFQYDMSTNRNRRDFDDQNFYWIDMGNSKDYGQIVFHDMQAIGTGDANFKPLSYWFNQMKDRPEEPSCSMAESLEKQSLFINGIMSKMCGQLLWDLFRSPDLTIDYQGAYINLKEMEMRAIRFIDPDYMHFVRDQNNKIRKNGTQSRTKKKASNKTGSKKNVAHPK